MCAGKQLVYLTAITILLFPATHVFAENNYGQYVDKAFDWFKGFTSSSVNKTDIDPQYKDKITNAIETGTPVAQKGADFWLALHHWVVEQLLANSPIHLDVGIATILSLGLVGFALFHFIKKLGKFIIFVGLIIIGIVLFITVFGIKW